MRRGVWTVVKKGVCVSRSRARLGSAPCRSQELWGCGPMGVLAGKMEAAPRVIVIGKWQVAGT
jgi:hypothetical protein